MASAALRVTAPAKVNLYLAVGGMRPDGYHEVTTVLQALDLADTVTLRPGGPFAFSCEPDLGLPGEQNLACCAARAAAERFGRPLEVSVTVEKRIPAAAGLGGASSDAAAVLTGLAALWGIGPESAQLVEIAQQLGADVPFFLVGGAALYSGRGHILERRLPSLDAPVVLICPDQPVPTAAAYSAFDALPPTEPPPVEPLLDALESGDPAGIGTLLHNNMTRASLGLAPEIADALALVSADPGVLGAGMAGSGSGVFGICAAAEAATRLASRARAAGFWAEATRATGEGCRIEAI